MNDKLRDDWWDQFEILDGFYHTMRYPVEIERTDDKPFPSEPLESEVDRIRRRRK